MNPFSEKVFPVMEMTLSLGGISNSTESFSEKWSKNSRYIATFVMSIAAIISFFIILLYCCCKKYWHPQTKSKVMAEVKTDQNELNEFDLPPTYSTLGL